MDPLPPSAPTEVQLRAPAEPAGHRWELEARRYQEVHDRSPDGMMIFRSVRGADGKIVDFEWLYSNTSAGEIVGHKVAKSQDFSALQNRDGLVSKNDPPGDMAVARGAGNR